MMLYFSTLKLLNRFKKYSCKNLNVTVQKMTIVQFFIIVLCANGTHPKCWHNVTNEVQIALAGGAKSSKQKTFG